MTRQEVLSTAVSLTEIRRQRSLENLLRNTFFIWFPALKSIFCIETVLKSATITFILIHVFFFQKEKFQNDTSDSFIHFSSWARVWLSWWNCMTKEYLRQTNYEKCNYIIIWWNTDIELLKWWMERRMVWA